MKQKEVKELSIDELNEKLVSFQKELSDLKMTHAISPIENPMQIKNLRKTMEKHEIPNIPFPFSPRHLVFPGFSGG